MSNNTSRTAAPTHVLHAPGYMNVPVVMGTDEEQARVQPGEVFVYHPAGHAMICREREVSPIKSEPREPDRDYHYDVRTIARTLRALAARLDAAADPVIPRTWLQIDLQVTNGGTGHAPTADERRATVARLAALLVDGVDLVADAHGLANYPVTLDGATVDIYTSTLGA